MAAPFSAKDQLRAILGQYPACTVEIRGVILDYLGRTGESVVDVFEMNRGIYRDLFLNGDRSEARELLARLLRTSEERDRLIQQCRKEYPVVSELLEELHPLGADGSTFRAYGGKELLADPARYFGYKVAVVLWQLSDIHFGKLNKLEPDPKELALQLAKAARDYPSVQPNLVVVSGDITTAAGDSEFADFVAFCRHLGQALWGAPHPERILVVPGNHDVTWLADGKADRMTAFVTRVAKSGVCITPFGPLTESLDGGRVNVWRCGESPDTVPPYACVTYGEHGIEFLLLVSGYFSGTIPEKIRLLINTAAPGDKEIQELVRSDEGAVSREYLFNLTNVPERKVATRLAVIHHNPIPYGVETCPNRFASQLLEALHKKSVPIIIHGHTHLMEDPSSARIPARRQTYPVPCTTLCSVTTTGGRGMSIHLLGEPDVERNMSTLTWQISESSALNEDLIATRYRFRLGDGTLSVRHA